MAKSFRKTQKFDCLSLQPKTADPKRSRRTLRRKAREAVDAGNYNAYTSLYEIRAWDVRKIERIWVHPEVYRDTDPRTGKSPTFEKFMRK